MKSYVGSLKSNASDGVGPNPNVLFLTATRVNCLNPRPSLVLNDNLFWLSSRLLYRMLVMMGLVTRGIGHYLDFCVEENAFMFPRIISHFVKIGVRFSASIWVNYAM